MPVEPGGLGAGYIAITESDVAVDALYNEVYINLIFNLARIEDCAMMSFLQ